MTISAAIADDIPALDILVNSAYRGDTAMQGWTNEARLLDGLRTDPESLAQMMHKKHAVILKYCNNDKVIEGCVYLEKKDTVLYLGMLTVSPKLQSSGIGKQLLYASEEYALRQGCKSIEMTVISIRHELIEWYERHGYYKTGDRKPFPTDEKFGIAKQPLEFIVMKKVL